MTVLVNDLPQKDLNVVGFQGDHQMADAHYRYRSALRGTGKVGTGLGTLDLVVHIEHGEEDLP